MASSERGYARRVRVHRYKCRVSGDIHSRHGGAGAELAVLLICVRAVGVRIPLGLRLAKERADEAADTPPWTTLMGNKHGGRARAHRSESSSSEKHSRIPLGIQG